MLDFLKQTWLKLLLTLAVFLLLSAAIVWIVNDGYEKGRAGLKEFYSAQLNLLAQKAQATGFSRRGDQQLQSLLNTTLHSELDIAYAYINRGRGEIIHTFDGQLPAVLQKTERQLNQEVRVQKIRLGEAEFYDFARLYSLSTGAEIHIGVSARVIDLPSVKNSIIPILLFGVLAVIVSVVALYFILSGPSAESAPRAPRRSRRKQKEEPHWKELFNNTPAAVVLYNSETGEIKEANQAFASLSGRSIRSLIGKDITSYMVNSEDESVPLNLVDDVQPENTVYLKKPRGEMIAMHAEAQELYIQSELHQLVAGFNINELIQHQASLRSERNVQSSRATMDQMTRLFNRQGIQGHAEAELNRAERGSPLSLLMLDIDNFKNINDTYGHDAGDRVIIRIAEIMNNTKRPYDWAGRWGGEEFMILLPGTTLEQAAIAAERLRLSIAGTTIHVSRGKDLSVTVSIGLASTEAHSTGSVTLSSLVKAADEALYEAKKSGRNRSMVYESGSLTAAEKIV